MRWIALLVLAGALLMGATKGVEGAEPKVLVRGLPIHGANGVMFDAEDRLHIASVVGREIVVMDPESGEILDRLGPDVGVESPDDLTFGPDGSLYWTAIHTGEVGRLSPDGTKTGQSVALGVNPITFSDDGRLFVALDFLGDALYELDPDLVNPPRLIAEDLGFLNGMDWGPDGFLYGPLYAKGQVVRIDVDTGSITTVADGFTAPAAVKFDSQGRLHVVDSLFGVVWRVDTETGNKQAIATGLPILDNLAFDSQDRLFVSDVQDGAILEVLPGGTTRRVSSGGMIGPQGVAVLPSAEGESVFVADSQTLREFDGLTGQQKSVVRTLGFPDTVSPDGDQLVLSSWSNLASLGVQEIGFQGTVTVWNPAHKALAGQFDFAMPLNAIRFQDDLVVVDLTSVVRVSAADPEVREMLAEGLDTPAGLAATDDDLWVSELGTGSVLQVIADGEPLSEPMPVAAGLSSPEGLAVTPGGNLLVVEAGAGRLSFINTATGEVSAVAEGLELGAEGPPGVPGTWGFNGVAVGPSGAIYVTGEIGNVLYRIEPLVGEPPVIAPTPSPTAIATAAAATPTPPPAASPTPAPAMKTATPAAIAPPPGGAGSPSGTSWPWWPLAVAGGAAAGAAAVLVAYRARRARE